MVRSAPGPAVYSFDVGRCWVAEICARLCWSVSTTMESVKSMRLRKTCPKCGAVVHAKRAVCDCGHAVACKRKARCSDDHEPKKATKRKRAPCLLCYSQTTNTTT